MSESTSDPDAVNPVEAPAEAETKAKQKQTPEEESTESTSTSFEIGDLVADREPADGNANIAVVVNCPPQPASEWTAYPGTTVAEDNTDHPEDASVIVTVYRSELERFDEKWADRDDPYPLTEFNEFGLSYYSFPATRLEHRPAEEETTAEGTDDGPATENGGSDTRMSQITHENTTTSSSRAALDSQSHADEAGHEEEADADESEDEPREPTNAALRLGDRLEDGGMTVEIEADGRTLAAEKLGETYRVQPGGEVLDGDGLFAAKLEGIAAEFEPEE